MGGCPPSGCQPMFRFCGLGGTYNQVGCGELNVEMLEKAHGQGEGRGPLHQFQKRIVFVYHRPNVQPIHIFAVI